MTSALRRMLRNPADDAASHDTRARRRAVTLLGVLAVTLGGVLVAPAAAHAEGEAAVIVGDGPTYGPASGGASLTWRSPAVPIVPTTAVAVGDDADTHYAIGGGDVYRWANGSAAPELLPNPDGLRFAKLATGGASTVYGLTSDGQVYAWGAGELGNPAYSSSDVPVPVLLPQERLPEGRLLSYVDIAGNEQGGFAVRQDGDVYAWGSFPNRFDYVGQPFATQYPTPVDVGPGGAADITRVWAAGDGDPGGDIASQWYAWDAAGNLYVFQNGRVDTNPRPDADTSEPPRVVRAPNGETRAYPDPLFAGTALTRAFFGTEVFLPGGAASDENAATSIADQRNGSWTFTAPPIVGCGPRDVTVAWELGGVTMQRQVFPGGYVIDTPCAPGGIEVSATGPDRISVSFPAPDPAYDGQPPVTGYTVTATPTSGGGAITRAGTSSPIVLTGLSSRTTYDISLRAVSTAGIGGEVTGAVTTPAASDDLAIIGVPGSLMYGDAGFTLGASGGLGAGAVTYAVTDGAGVLAVDPSTGAVTILTGGTATVTATKAASPGFAVQSTSLPITVAKRPVTVTGLDVTLPPGTSSEGYDFPYTISPALLGSDSIASLLAGRFGQGARVFTQPGETYLIGVRPDGPTGTVDSVFDNPKYAITWVPGYVHFAQPQAALAITGVPAALAYGDAGFALGASGGSGAGAATFSVAAGNGVLAVDPATGAVSILGAGTVPVIATKAGSGDFGPITVASSVTVAKRAVTVTAQNQSKVAGAADPALTYTASPALVAGDSLNGSLTYTGSAVGSYPITQAEVFANPNYTVAFVPGTMTITPNAQDQAALSITDPGTLTYGGTGFSLATSGGSGSGAVTFTAPADNGVLTVTPGGAASITGAGTVVVTATKAASAGFNAATATLPVTVGKAGQAALAITSPGALAFGGDDFSLAVTGGSGTGAVTYSVLASSDVLTVTPAGVASIIGAGTVEVTAAKGGDGNYDAAAATLSITVDKSPIAPAKLPPVSAPTAGQALDTTAPPSGTGFTAGPASWTSAGWPVTGTPAPGAAYTATLTLTAQPGYTFTGLTLPAPQPGEPAATVSDNTGDTVTLTYAFEASASPRPTVVEQQTRTFADQTVTQRSFDFVLAMQVGGATAGSTPWPNTNHFTVVDVAPGELVARRIDSATGYEIQTRTSVDADGNGVFDEGETTTVTDAGRTDADPVYVNAQHAYDLVSGNKKDKLGELTVTVDWNGDVTATATFIKGSSGGDVTWGLYDKAADVPKAPGQLNGGQLNGGQFSGATITGSRLTFTLTGHASTGATSAPDPQWTGWSEWAQAASPARTATFDANGGAGVMAAQTADTATALTENGFTREGYVFIGWNTEADGAGVAYTPGASYPFIADVTLYAQWQADPAARD